MRGIAPPRNKTVWSEYTHASKAGDNRYTYSPVGDPGHRLFDRSPAPALCTREAIIEPGSASYSQKTDAVIIRDESVFSSGTIARVEYVAMENTLLNAGDTIAYLYSTGYSESELERLEDIRANIQAYHKTILNNIVDNDLNRLDRIVDMRALELKSLVTHQTTGNLLSLVRQLESAMVDRQDYMRANQREDLNLNRLYQDESTRMNSIASWRTEATADEAGVISFYTDGYESALTPDALGRADARGYTRRHRRQFPGRGLLAPDRHLPPGGSGYLVRGHTLRRAELEPGARSGVLPAIRGL